MLTVKLVVDGRVELFKYDSIESVFYDKSLKALFDDELVSSCQVMDKDGVKVTHLPLMEWDRLVDAVISNSTVILRKAYQGG